MYYATVLQEKEAAPKEVEKEEEEEEEDEMGFGLFSDDEGEELYSSEESASEHSYEIFEPTTLVEEEEEEEEDQPLKGLLLQLSEQEIDKLFGAQNTVGQHLHTDHLWLVFFFELLLLFALCLQVDCSWPPEALKLCRIDAEKVANLLLKAGAKSLGIHTHTHTHTHTQ